MPTTNRVWSEQQLQAISAGGGNVLVSAAAGSGKTAVLTERVVRYILSGGDIRRVLVVTFTEAAASHMRSSISKALRAKAQEPEISPEESARLQRQLALLPTAPISTLHSFCLDLCREFFEEIGFDQGASVLSEAETSIMMRRAAKALLDEDACGPDLPLLQGLLRSMACTKDSSLMADAVIKLYSLVSEQPFPELWLDRVRRSYLPEAVETRWYPMIRRIAEPVFACVDDMRESLAPWLECLEERLAAASEKTTQKAAEEKAKTEKYIDEAEALRYALSECSGLYRDALGQNSARLLLGALDAVRNVQPIRLYPRRDSAEKAIADAYSACKSAFGQLVKKIPSGTYDDLMAGMAEQYPQADYLCRLITRFDAAYTEAKADSSSIDFTDMERGAMRLLWKYDPDTETATLTDIARLIRGRYETVMEDEYQDSNYLQEWILRAISSGPESVGPGCEMTPDLVSAGPGMFMVGDIKQSIYRFRNAEPELFVSKYKAYPAGTGGTRVDMQGNYRSSPAVIDAINAIFRRHMSESLGGVAYDENACLVACASPETSGAEKPAEIYDTGAVDELEAVISVIRSHVGQKEFYDRETGRFRPYRFSDIVVLMRSAATAGPRLKDALEDAGIPAYSVRNSAYLDSYEIRVVLSALRITDNPLRDVDLLTVALSPMFDMPADTPALLKAAFPDSECYYQRFRAAADSEAGDAAYAGLDPSAVESAIRDCRAFCLALDGWRSMAKELRPERLVWHIITSTGFYDVVHTFAYGEIRAANLRLLFSYAVKYGGSSLKGTASFVRFLENLLNTGSDLPAIQQVAENAVTITTIHASKGLEFPLVILCGASSRFNTSDEFAPIICDSREGFAFRRYDPETGCRYNSVIYSLIADSIHRATLSEELRLLYVALTRAESHIVITGKLPSTQKDSADASSFMSWIAPVAEDNPELFEIMTELPDSADSAPATPEIDIDRAPMPTEADITMPDRLPENVSLAPSKVSVTRVERMFDGDSQGQMLRPMNATVDDRESQENAEAAEEPSDMARSLERLLAGSAGPVFSAADRGTINHLFMKELDFGRASSVDDLRSQLDTMVERGAFSPEEAALVNLEGAFFAANSDVMAKILSGGGLHREESFNMLVDYDELLDLGIDTMAEYDPSRANTLLQGIIDLWAEIGPSDAIVVDYKTGRLTGENLGLYRRQMQIYSIALTRLTGRRVIGRYVVFLDARRVCKV